jgi:hypothetical protein
MLGRSVKILSTLSGMPCSAHPPYIAAAYSRWHKKLVPLSLSLFFTCYHNQTGPHGVNTHCCIYHALLLLWLMLHHRLASCAAIVIHHHLVHVLHVLHVLIHHLPALLGFLRLAYFG